MFNKIKFVDFFYFLLIALNTVNTVFAFEFCVPTNLGTVVGLHGGGGIC